jgi:uncharacterized protein YecT (DUF1311 family)
MTTPRTLASIKTSSCWRQAARRNSISWTLIKLVFTVADTIYVIEREPPSGAARLDDKDRMEACLKLVADNRKARGAYTEPFLEEAPTAAARLEGVSKEARYLNSSCVGAIAYPCIAKHDDDATRNACYDRERAFWDERLNANYKRALAKADPDVAASYKKIERAWVAWRDARCAHPQIEFQGAMAGPMVEQPAHEVTGSSSLSSTLRNLCRVAKRFRESFHEGGWNFYTVRWMPRH